jgi:hypothetical protein
MYFGRSSKGHTHLQDGRVNQAGIEVTDAASETPVNFTPTTQRHLPNISVLHCNCQNVIIVFVSVKK